MGVANVLQVRSAGVTMQALSLTALSVEHLNVEEVKTSAPPARGMGWYIETALYVLRMMAACSTGIPNYTSLPGT
jgi:hypothetical protein